MTQDTNMQSSGIINSSTDDDLIWRDVCLASAWFDRAQNLLDKTSTVQTNPEIVIDSAQKALSYYQGCFVRVKKRASLVSPAAAAVESKPSQPQDPPEMGVGINLELRIAQTLRLLAAIHAAADDEEDTAAEQDGGSDEEKDEYDKHPHFKAAVQCHDDAVSLLVGVFEDEDDGQSYSQCQFSTDGGHDIARDLSWEGGRDQFSPQISPMIKEALHENDNFTVGEDATAMAEVDRNNNILLTIHVSSCAKLLPHTTLSSQPTQVTFFIPAEEQRVRAIAMSLNAMAELHARKGNDGAAMESFREALEILRAATEEHEEVESLNGKRQYGKKSRVEVDLANTLQGVGNFHLRRDELDAAFNAYSTVWALFNGLDVMASSSSQDGVEGASQMLAIESSPIFPDLDRSRPRKNIFACENDVPVALAALNNLGIVHERRGELEEALSCYDQVLRARIESLGSDHFDTANALINIGNCYQRKLDWGKAVVAYKEATSIYRKLSHRQQTSKNGLASVKNDMIRLQRSLAGVLRNWGTCCWKQRNIPEAIDLLNESVNTEEKLISDSLDLAVSQKLARQCMESMAQMLGILGCLYVEYSLVENRSFENSEGAFNMALQIYEELGYENTSPSVVWANSNLASVRLMSVRFMSPPPAPTPSSSKASPEKAKFTQSDEIDFDEIDSIGLDEVLDEGDDSLFSGVDDSTQELDEILSDSRHLQDREHPRSKNEQNDFDGSPFSRPLSQEQRNQSRTSLNSEKDPEETTSDREKGDSNEDKEKFLFQQKGSYGDESIEAAEAHLSLAQHLWEKGDRESATEHYTEAHSVFQSRLGDCKEVALILKSLGDLNKEDGKLVAAKELYSEALDIEMSVFGHHRPQTLNATGVVCLMLDDFRSAMEYHRRALQIQKKKVAVEHKYEMFETLVLIGNVYYSEQNNLSNIRTQGVDYKDFIESGFLGWIANAHDMRGEYGKAIQFYEESLQMAMSRSGKELKKETALTLNRLGSLTRELGRYDEAMDYHKKALSIQNSSSKSVAKAMTAETCVLMGMVKAKTGEYKTALNLFEDAVLTLKGTLGAKHLSVTKTLAQIGQLHFQLSCYDKAFASLQEAERIQLETVGEMNRDTLETQALIGRVLTATGEYDSASNKLKSVLEKQQSVFGVNHPSIAETNQFIAENFLEQGMSSEARGTYVEVYNMRKIFFTMDQIQMAESMVDVIRARNGRPERALAIYRNAMDVYREYLPDDHVLIGRLLVYEGDAHAELLNFSTAIGRYEEARKIFRKSVGDCAIDSAQVAVNMGKVLMRKCDYDGAKEEFNTALSHYNQLLPINHPRVSSTLSHLGRVEEEEALCV